MKFFLRNFFLLFLIILFLPNPLSASTSVEGDIESIFNKYSKYLDSTWKDGGWVYNVPSRHYNEKNLNSLDNIRMQGTFASAYLYRNDVLAKERVQSAVKDFLTDDTSLGTLRKSKRSFNDAIGLYLFLNIIEKKPNWFSAEEKEQVATKVKKYLVAALRAPDQENRAFVGAAFGLAAINHPALNLSVGEKERYIALVRDKVKEGLKSVDKNGVYHEGKKQKYSAHYHLVSAQCLWLIGETLADQNYLGVAKKMNQYFHQKYPWRKLTWQGSERPTGIGLQTVLLRALGEKSLGNKDWQRYWRSEKLRRGFIDYQNQDRLVWRDEVDGTFNDDYSFLSMAVLFGEVINN